jgi:hypothetical protein
MQLGSHPNPGAFATVVEAFWQSDKQDRLRDVEMHRRVIEYKSKRATGVGH